MARNNKLTVRRSSSAGATCASGLSAGEIAFNTNDGIMFVGTSDTNPHAIVSAKFPAISGVTAGGGQVVPTDDGLISILVNGSGPLGLTRDASNTDSMTFTIDDTVLTTGDAISGVTAGGGQVVPTADGKISILVGSDGPLGLTRDASNTDSMTFTLDDTVVTVGNFTYEAGEPSSTVGGAGSAPSAGSFKILEFVNAGFILEVDDSFSDGSDATNFFNEINASAGGSVLYTFTFKRVDTGATAVYSGGGNVAGACNQVPFCDEGTRYFCDYNPGDQSNFVNVIANAGDLIEISVTAQGTKGIVGAEGSGTGVKRTYGGYNPSYGWTAGNGVPANPGDFAITALNGILANTTKILFHKSDLDNIDQRSRNLDLSSLLTKKANIDILPFKPGVPRGAGFTTGNMTFKTAGTGSYNGTYYSLDVDSFVIDANSDGISTGTEFFVDIAFAYEEARVAGYTAQSDAPSGAETGDFWLESDTSDLFFYNGDAFVQISGADGSLGGVTAGLTLDGDTLGFDVAGPSNSMLVTDGSQGVSTGMILAKGFGFQHPSDSEVGIQLGANHVVKIGDPEAGSNDTILTVDDNSSAITLRAGGTNYQTINSSGTNFADTDVVRPVLKDFSETVKALGSKSTSFSVDFEEGNVQTVTIGGDCTISFANAPASGKAGTCTLIITNGGAHTVSWIESPQLVKWPGNIAPALTSSGIDILSFLTTDAGVTVYGFVGGINFQ